MSRDARRVVVVGASAAGLRCAARLARLQPGWSITVVERDPVFSVAACGLPYVLSGDIEAVERLRRTADGALRDEAYFRDVKGVEVRTGAEVTGLDIGSRNVVIRSDGAEETLAWDDLVLATGARARRLPGQPVHARVSTFHTAADLPALFGGLTGGRIGRVVVVGSGLVGCELAEAFRALWGVDVTVVEATPAPLPGMLDVELGGTVAVALARAGVILAAGAPVTAVEADERGARVSAGGRLIEADQVVVAVGVEPETGLARQAGIALGPTGAIAVDERLATSVAGVWAAGDCIEVRHAVTGAPACMPLGSLANRQGRTLANVLAGRDDRLPPVVGAVAVKVFDWNVAAVAWTRRRRPCRGARRPRGLADRLRPRALLARVA
jgi:NADPH-dependent 2,4-dienoyl-CoA reductase/sulfur reductase-like enzyme